MKRDIQMKLKTILFSLAALYALTGCGGSAGTAEGTTYTRGSGTKLHLIDVKTDYYIGEKFQPVFTAVDENGIDVSRWVNVVGDVDTTQPGEYRVKFQLLDSRNNVLDEVEKMITVSFNQAPVITLYGGDQVDVYVGYAYDEPGFEAIDKEEGDLSKRVLVTSDVDTTTIGIYHVTYRVKDSYGNESTKTRTVRVIPLDDIRVEVISQSNDTTQTYALWDYLVDQSQTQHNYTKYKNNLKEHEQTNSVTAIDSDHVKVALPYTLRTLSYEKSTDDSFEIAFMQDDDKLRSVTLKNSLHIGDVITQESTGDNERLCRLNAHYDAIILADKEYQDVVRITCGNSEAYFEKGKGIILENSYDTQDVPYDLLPQNAHELALKTIMYPSKIPLGEFNLESMRQSRTDMLADAPYNLHGRGIKVGIVDEGAVLDSHQEIAGRVENLTAEPVSEHTTHIAGTIGAEGIDPDSRGYANEVEMKVISFYDRDTGTNGDVPLYFNYAIEKLMTLGVYISNHSYGDASSESAGVYGRLSFDTDKLVTRYPNIIAVASAGNDRGGDEYADYGIIKDFSTAKNLITVGAIDYDGKITAFSSTGPVKNGRIKPDIVTKGYMVKSLGTNANDAYMLMSGTSMAAPAVTGAMALFEEEYIKVNHVKMREDTAKALIVNTAEDLGRAGPDYEYGFGLLDSLDVVKAIDTMQTEDTLVQLKTIDDGQKHTYDLHMDALGTFKATLCWIDPEVGFDVGDGSLRTDLDLTIIDKNLNTVVYAYSLDGDNPEDLARQDRYNRVDNVEQVVAKLPKGDYTVQVSVHRAGKEQQAYTLVSNVALKNWKENSSYSKIEEFETVIYDSVAE
jgi:subtilisin family serine protease